MKTSTIAGVISLSLFSTGASAVMDTIPAKPEAQVTKTNWTVHPYNQWAFRNVGLHPSVMVPRSGEITQIPEALDANIANIEFEYQGETFTVDQAMIGDNTDGYIVIQGGKVLHEAYFNGFTERDHHLWASSTKSLTGQALGLLVAQGKVDVNAQVQTYIPELKDTHFGERRVRELLNMVSALDYTEDYVNMTPGAVSTEYFSRLGFIPNYELMALDPTEDSTPRGLLEYAPMFEKNPNLEPSHTYEYHSPNVDVIGWLISRVSGQPLQTFVADNIWSKLGTEHDALFWTDMTFVPIATGGFNTTLRDFARVGLAMVNDGEYNGQQVFDKAWVQDTFNLTDEERLHTQRSIYKQADTGVYDEWLEGYKNFLWVHDSEKGIGSFRGVFGQVLYINQEKDLVIATFSSTKSASNAARLTNRPRMAAFDAIADSIK